jgi:hypothetical protein
MGREAFQISTCYKMAGLGKLISYKMSLKIGLIYLIWALRTTIR